MGNSREIKEECFSKKFFSSLFGRDTEIISTQYSRTIMSLLSFLTEFKPNWCQNEKPQFNLTSTTHNYHFSESTCDAVDLLINKAPKIDNSTWTLDLAYIKNLFENKNSNVDDWNGRQVEKITLKCKFEILGKIQSLSLISSKRNTVPSKDFQK